ELRLKVCFRKPLAWELASRLRLVFGIAKRCGVSFFFDLSLLSSKYSGSATPRSWACTRMPTRIDALTRWQDIETVRVMILIVFIVLQIYELFIYHKVILTQDKQKP